MSRERLDFRIFANTEGLHASFAAIGKSIERVVRAFELVSRSFGFIPEPPKLPPVPNGHDYHRRQLNRRKRRK